MAVGLLHFSECYTALHQRRAWCNKMRCCCEKPGAFRSTSSVGHQRHRLWRYVPKINNVKIAISYRFSWTQWLKSRFLLRRICSPITPKALFSFIGYQVLWKNSKFAAPPYIVWSNVVNSKWFTLVRRPPASPPKACTALSRSAVIATYWPASNNFDSIAKAHIHAKEHYATRQSQYNPTAVPRL